VFREVKCNLESGHHNMKGHRVNCVEVTCLKSSTAGEMMGRQSVMSLKESNRKAEQLLPWSLISYLVVESTRTEWSAKRTGEHSRDNWSNSLLGKEKRDKD